MIAILHNLRSAHNVGSIFRTSDSAGIKKLYLCGITPAPIDHFGHERKQLTKVSLGAEKSVAWEKVGQAWRLIDQLKTAGYKIIALEITKTAIPYYQFKKNKKQPIALILGSETKGLPQSILTRADHILKIPMRGHKESLNVAVAYGVVVFHFSVSRK